MTKNNTAGTPLIIFTDLDATLLDHVTYSSAPAEEALEAIKVARIPLIFCSSKTRAEIEVWRERLDNHDPFIAENGGAIFFPAGSPLPASAKAKGDYFVVELGMPHGQLAVLYFKLKSLFGTKIRGFSEMDLREVIERTGLPQADAARARQREYTEPFIFAGNEHDQHRLEHAAEDLGLRLTYGGRFYHLLADNDKGKAVSIVAEAYRKQCPSLQTIALGDSANDLPMLKAVNIPVLIQKPGGIYDPKIVLHSGVRRAPGVGPVGWNQAVLELIGRK
jgi:mannosyl-3-phosphoglycerate phosphatase